MHFTDSHVHLDFSAFNSSRAQLISQCQQQGIKRFIVPSVAPSNWQQVLELAQQFNGIFPAIGFHPWYLKGLSVESFTDYEQFIATHQSKLIALGEMGLDGVIAKEQNNLNQQVEFFERQLLLANQFQLPVIVHHRRTHEETLTILKKMKPQKGGIIHAFSGSYQQASRYIDLGFKLGIGGTISYQRAKKTINAIKRLPIESLVLETDAPAMPLSGYQGQDNSLLRLLDIFDYLDEIRTEPKEQLAQQLEQNIDQLFF